MLLYEKEYKKEIVVIGCTVVKLIHSSVVVDYDVQSWSRHGCDG